VHLVGFIIRIHHDARSHERHIHHDARPPERHMRHDAWSHERQKKEEMYIVWPAKIVSRLSSV